MRGHKNLFFYYLYTVYSFNIWLASGSGICGFDPAHLQQRCPGRVPGHYLLQIFFFQILYLLYLVFKLFHFCFGMQGPRCSPLFLLTLKNKEVYKYTIHILTARPNKREILKDSGQKTIIFLNKKRKLPRLVQTFSFPHRTHCHFS